MDWSPAPGNSSSQQQSRKMQLHLNLNMFFFKFKYLKTRVKSCLKRSRVSAGGCGGLKVVIPLKTSPLGFSSTSAYPNSSYVTPHYIYVEKMITTNASL